MKKNNTFNHFVITQFNLRNLLHSIDNITDWINWTRERIVLFREFCLPSFLNQTNKNFTWLIYFDSKTPDEFQYLFDELNAISFIRVQFADGLEDFMTKYLLDMKTINPNKEWIISTRCDNDDCLEKDAIDAIQNHFIPKDKFLISLASGYTLDIQDFTLSHYYYPQSPFISIIESNSKDLKGIFYKGHTIWNSPGLKIMDEICSKNKTSIFVLRKPLWMQIIHGNNVSNSHRRGLPVLKPKILNDFGISIKTKRQSIFNILNYREYYYWKRYLKSFLVKIIKQK